MRLFLSSYRFGNHSNEYADLFHVEKKVAIITNAQDVYTDDNLRQQKVDETITELNEVGLTGEEFDLRNYFEKPDELKEELKKYDGVWVRGGNAFVLRKAMRYSGFDHIISEILKKDELIYGGYSAGACVLGKTMHGLEYCDDMHAVPKGYKKEIIWEGVDIIPYTIVPHYKSDHPEAEMIDEVVRHMQANRIAHKTLRDGEVIVINGSQEKLLI